MIVNRVRKDITTVIEARSALPEGSVFRAEHFIGATEPLLWMSDIVAGAVRAQRQGDTRTRTSSARW